MKAGDWQQLLQQWVDAKEIETKLPEVALLNRVPQAVEFHSEGDALTHTLMAVRAISPGSDERVFWATLLHDVGKASTTKYVEGRWRAIGHVKQGTALVAPILERFNLCRITSDVKWLVKHHHFALDWGDSVLAGLSQRQKKLCDSPLFPLLVEVCRADDVASLGSSEKGSKLDFILAQLK